MGYSLTWYAVRGKSPRQVWDDFGLEPNGEREPLAESPLVGIQLPGDWYVIVANHNAVFGILANDKRLSAGCELITCSIEEHVMCSNVERWVNGQKVWSVFHDSSSGIFHLESEGTLPPAFGEIRDRLMTEQQAAGGSHAEVDFTIDIPLELAEALTGFRHDIDFVESGDDPFEVLQVKAEIAAGVDFRLRRVFLWCLGKLAVAAFLAFLLFGLCVALFGVLAVIMTIIQRLG
jgi:hypothetical protein